MPTVVVPAHDEQAVIGRLLDAVTGQHPPVDVIVVANGCRDATAAVAAAYPGVRVIETPVPSKSSALRLGDAAAAGFPRLYVDADVVLGVDDVGQLCRAVQMPGTLAAGPAREIPMGGVALPVRWFYDVWQRLPGVRDELFGRGVIAVNEQGHARLAPFLSADSEIMADDLAMAMAFDAAERTVVETARVTIRPPRTYRDLLRRRVRMVTGNAVLEDAAARPAPRTGLRQLVRVAADEPGVAGTVRLLPKVALFMATAVIARLRARRAVRTRDTRWLRDDSSRT